jgi:non-homologous end joining protein Ku
MTTNLKIGLINIPVLLINTTNSRYSTDTLHLFSSCCNEKVKMKKVCSGCGKDLLATEISKGLDEKTILTEEQQEKLKESLENNVIEVIAIKDINENMLYEFIPFIQKSQFVFPSISKGYQKSNIKTYYSFVNALTELKKYLICKFVSRGLEHLTIVMPYKDKILLIELPFKKYSNLEETIRIDEAVKNIIRTDKITELTQFSTQAKDFISSFGNKVNELEEAVEEKKVLLKQFIKQIREKGECEFLEENEMSAVQTEVNPFVRAR